MVCGCVCKKCKKKVPLTIEGTKFLCSVCKSVIAEIR